MPYDEPEPDDPQMLVGVSVPGDRQSNREMATAFAEEFARLGLNRSQILALFQNPFYAGAHDALTRVGEAEITRLVDESLRVWERVRVTVKDAPEPTSFTTDGEPAGSGRSLRVLT